MGGGREILTLISTAAIVRIGMTIANAKSIVPKSDPFNFAASSSTFPEMVFFNATVIMRTALHMDG